MRGYGQPSPYEASVQRGIGRPLPEIAPGTGVSNTPLQYMDGFITPNGLHFERHHNGVPDIDPKTHKVLIHGLVQRPLTFTVEDLLRYPMVSRRCSCLSIGSTGCSPAPSGPACHSGCCWRRQASIRAASGSWRKAPMPRA